MSGGFAGDLAWEVTHFFLGIARQVVTVIASAVLRLLGRPRDDPKSKADRAAFEAKYPLANRKVTSFRPRGVFFGRQYNKYIIKPEELDGHVLVIGGPGTGKSSCIAIPTLRSWRGAVFAVDVKGELYENVKQYRKNIKVFEPQNKNNLYYYDPYIFLKNSGGNIAQEAAAIAQSIIPVPHGIKDPFWIENAQTILTGAILHYHHLKETFIETLRKIQSQSPQELINHIAKSPCDKAVLCGKPFSTMEGKILSGIFAEISRSIVTLVTDDDIVTALTPDIEREMITPADLVNGTDIYIKIPEHLLRQWKNLLTLMVNQFITAFERRPEKADNNPILFLLDEFPRLGKIPAITDALATLRSKKVTITLIAQSLAQLEMIYGHDARRVIADTCAFKAVLGATDADTQEYFSKLVGTHEKVRSSHSTNYDPYIHAPTGSGSSFSQDYEKRLIKPEEFATLQEIILLYPMPLNFCRVQKQPYFKTERPK